MKWVTFISCLFLFSFMESKYLYRAYREAEQPPVTIKHVSELSGGHLQDICLVLFSQFLQKSTYGEVHKLVKDTVALANKCTADEHSDPQCTKPLGAVLLDEICHEEGIASQQGFSDFCAQPDPERHERFLTHKNGSREYISPFPKLDPESTCQQFHDNKVEALNHYLYEASRRHPFTKVVTFLHGKEDYEKVLTECCQAEDKHACFGDKVAAATKRMLKAIGVEKHQCSILKKFGMKMLQGLKIAQMSQKFPKANFLTITDLSEKVGHIYEECCRGDILDCMLDREKLATYICSHQDSISSKLHACCEKPVLERGECIVHAENDDKPADLSETVREFIDDEAVCQYYADNKGVHLAKFIYENSRRHDELAPVMLLRLVKGYKELMENCCVTDHQVACLQEGEELLKKHISDSAAMVKAYCDLYKQLGNYLFQNELIVSYGKKAPQLTPNQMRAFTRRMVGVAADCCHQDDAHRVACAENHLDLALGFLCYLYEKHPINKQVCKCCGDSYSKRRECFTALRVDPEYVPVLFNPEVVRFHANYCTAKSEEQQEKKQIVLIHMIQHKPDMTDKQLASVLVNLTGVVTGCCAAEDRDECFNTELRIMRHLGDKLCDDCNKTCEIPKVIEQTKAALGEH